MDPVEIAFLDILPSLTDAVALEPDNFANQLMKRGLIPKRIWQNSLSSSVQPFDKSNQLMVAIQTRLSSDHAAVNPLSDALRSIPTLSPFADRLLTAMGQRGSHTHLVSCLVQTHDQEACCHSLPSIYTHL